MERRISFEVLTTYGITVLHNPEEQSLHEKGICFASVERSWCDSVSNNARLHDGRPRSKGEM